MILSDRDIIKLLKAKKLVVEPAPKDEDIRCNHINLHLANELLYYDRDLDLATDRPLPVKRIIVCGSYYALAPQEFRLGSTIEKVTIPNGYFGLVETKGNVARAGIQAHNADGHIDPGFSGNITLEIKNNLSVWVEIQPGMAFVQLYIFKCSSLSLHPYNGKYQNQIGATTYKKD